MGLRENLQKEMGRTCISYRHPEDADLMGQIPGCTEESVDEGVDFWESPEHTVGDRLPGRAVLGDYSSHMGYEPVRLCHPLSSGRELGALLLGRGLFLHIEVYLSLKCCLNLNVPIVVYSRCSRGGGEQGTLRGTSTRAGLGVPAFWGFRALQLQGRDHCSPRSCQLSGKSQGAGG